MMADFEKWWANEGSGMPPRGGDDCEQHCYKMCAIAWANGEYVAKRQADKGAE